MNRLITGAAIAAALTLSAGTATAEIGWSVGVGAGRSDNANRVETGKIDDTLMTLGGALAYELESPRVQASISGNATYLDYLDNTYDSDFLASGDGSLVFGIMPERFLWTFEDTFGQITINQFQPVTPENRQNANYFSTGPDLFLRLGSQTDLRIGGRYADSRYEESDTANDQRLSGDIALIRRTSPQVAWSAVGSASRVEYDVPGNPGYDLQSIFGRVEAEGARQTVNLDLGATRIADGGESYTNPLVRLTWNRLLTPSWTMDLSLGSEYQNTGDRFVSGAGGPDGGTGGVNVSNIPSENYRGALTFSFTRPRTGFYIGTGYSRDNYIRSGLEDQTVWSARLGVSRRFTQRLQGFADATYQQRDFQSAIGGDNTRMFSTRLDWSFGRATFVTVGYRYEDRSSDIGTNGYTENLIYLSVSYRYGTIGEARNFAF